MVKAVEPNTSAAPGVTGGSTVCVSAAAMFAGMLGPSAGAVLVLVDKTEASSASVGVSGVMVDTDSKFEAVVVLALFAEMLVIFSSIAVTSVEVSTDVVFVSSKVLTPEWIVVVFTAVAEFAACVDGVAAEEDVVLLVALASASVVSR